MRRGHIISNEMARAIMKYGGAQRILMAAPRILATNNRADPRGWTPHRTRLMYQS